MSKGPLLAVCLLGASVAIILRAADHQPAGELVAATPSDRASGHPIREPDDVVVVNSGAKADRLLIATSANATKGVAVEPQVVAPTDKKGIELIQAESKSWHWNARSNKITRK
jgi:hypothetical protein